MIESKHSQTPWRVGDAGKTVFGPKRDDGFLPTIVASCDNGSDSRLIVRAVNSFDDLLAACRAAAGVIGRLGLSPCVESPEEPNCGECDNCLDRKADELLSAALARAEGGAE